MCGALNQRLLGNLGWKDVVRTFNGVKGMYHAGSVKLDRFSCGNMKDLRFSMKTSPLKVLTVIGNVHLFYLAEARGDWLNVVSTRNVFAGAPGFTQTRADAEIDLKMVYSAGVIKGLKLVGLYGIFNPGAAVSERNGGKAYFAKFGYILADYKFV